MKLTLEDLFYFYADVRNIKAMAKYYLKDHQAGMDKDEERLYKNLIYAMQMSQDALKPFSDRYLNSNDEDE